MALNKAKTYDKDDLVVGRGRLYFNRRRNGVFQGERYLGNTPELSLTSSVDKLDHFSSDHGYKDKDKTVNIENSRSGSFTTDIISVPNVALWFGGEFNRTLFSAQNDVVEVINAGNAVTKGFIYQLGVSNSTPQGQGGIDGSSFTIGYADVNTSISAGTGDISSIPGVTVLSDANYELDADRGQLYIEDNAPDITGEIKLVVKYNRKASTGTVIVSSDEIIEGSLRFESDNPTGHQKNYYIPLITISSDGDYALKGDDWQSLGFTFDVLKKDINTPPIIIYDNPVIGSGGSQGGNGNQGNQGGNGNQGGQGGNQGGQGGSQGGNDNQGGNGNQGGQGGNQGGNDNQGGNGNQGGGDQKPARVYSVSDVVFLGEVRVGKDVVVQAKVTDQDGANAPSGTEVFFNAQNGDLNSESVKVAGEGYATTTFKPKGAGSVSVGASTKQNDTQKRVTGNATV